MRQNTPEFSRTVGAYLAMSKNPDDAAIIASLFGIDRPTPISLRPPRRSFLYVMATEVNERRVLKIGQSVQPDIRLRQIQRGNGAAMPPNWEQGTPVQPVAFREGGLAEERAIHHDLREFRVPRTEWFIGAHALYKYIVEQDAWDEWNGNPIPPNYDFSTSKPAF